MLELCVTDFTGNTSWSWHLFDEAGRLLAEHDVHLHPESPDFRLLTDVDGNRWRLDDDPARRLRSERRLIRRVGAYAAGQVLGSIGPAIFSRGPVTVRVSLPPGAASLLAIPLELAHWQGKSLSERGTVFCYAPPTVPVSRETDRPALPTGKGDATSPLRALAVFALPETSSALGLVKERRALEAVMRDGPISRGEPPVELRILQYGATRQTVIESLIDSPGWDIIHLSGHGGPGRLYLENEQGSSEPVEADELIRWLKPSPSHGRAKLIVLSACESGVARAARILGGSPDQATGQQPIMLPALGYEIAQKLECAVLATRYPVDDRFSAAFIRLWYQAILDDGYTIADAVRMVLPAAGRAAPFAPLSVATPMLLGGPADLKLIMPGRQDAAASQPASTTRQRAPQKLAVSAPPVPEYFVGRTTLLTRVGGTLAPGSGSTGLMLLGMPGIGKTTACAEAVSRSAAAFDAIAWHRASRQETAQSLAAAIIAALPGMQPSRRARPGRQRLSGEPASDGSVIQLIRGQRVLMIIDNAQTLLSSEGAWADDDVETLITALLRPGAQSRLVLISDRPIAGLAGSVATFTVPMLSRSESEWLSVELQELDAAAGIEHGAGAEDLPWLVCRGHPKLIEYCSGGDRPRVLRRQRRLWHSWEVFSPLSPASAVAQRPLGRDHPGAAIRSWALERAASLPEASRRALAFLSVLEQADRDDHYTGYGWEAMGAVTGMTAEPWDAAVAGLTSAGLAERNNDGEYLLHPAIASVGRSIDRDVYAATATAMWFYWHNKYKEVVAKPDGADQGALAYCAASEVPYLMRLGRWEEASAVCELAISHDRSPNMAARLAPYAVEIIHTATGTPLEMKARFVHAVLASSLLPSKGVDHFQHLLERATKGADHKLVVVTAGSLAQSLARTDPLQAQRLIRLAIDANSEESLGPWVAAQLKTTYAEILYQLSAWRESLSMAEEALAELDRLEGRHQEPSGVNPRSLRLSAWQTATQAARRLGRPEQAAAYQASIHHLESTAADRSAAEAQFNDIYALIDRGQLDYAEQLLQVALSTFTGPSNARERGLTLIGLAMMEYRRRNPDDAVEFARQALQAAYAARETLDAASAHTHMASFLGAALPQVATEAPVHILAAAVIHMRVSGGLIALNFQLPDAISSFVKVALCRARQPALIPESFADLQQRLTESTGIDIGELLSGFERIPVRADAEPGSLRFSFNDPSDLAGDSVTDVLCWVQQQSSTPSSTTGCSDRWPPLTSHKPRPHYARHWP